MSQRIRTPEIALNATFTANQVIAMLRQAFGYSMSAYKPANQVVSASTAFVNDDSMWTELYGAGNHRVTMILPIPSITAAGGLKLALVADQGLTVGTVAMNAIFLLDGTAPAVKPITALGTGAAVNGGTTNAWTSVLMTGTVAVQNGGVLQLQWAQQAASGATTIGAGASLDTVQLL